MKVSRKARSCYLKANVHCFPDEGEEEADGYAAERLFPFPGQNTLVEYASSLGSVLPRHLSLGLQREGLHLRRERANEMPSIVSQAPLKS